METSTQVIGNEEIRLTPGSAAKFPREVRAKTRCQSSAEDEIGIVLEACSAWFLPRIVRIPQSMEWALTGRVFSAQEGPLIRGWI